jgi:hypothetical protein
MHGQEPGGLLGAFDAACGIAPHRAVGRQSSRREAAQGVPPLVLVDVTAVRVRHRVDPYHGAFQACHSYMKY